MSNIEIVDNLQFPELHDLDNFSIIISSAKVGNDVAQLRDNNFDTYWQSDGNAPHFINIQFNRKTKVSKLCLYLDYNTDESYTPKKLVVKTGTLVHDLTELSSFELNEPIGWIVISLDSQSLGLAPINDENEDIKDSLETFFIQIKFISMHQNGRDCHVRQLKMLGPRSSPKVMANFQFDSFKTVDMQQYAVLR